MTTEGDAVRATWAIVRDISATSYSIWSSYARQSNPRDRLPPDCVALQNLLGRVPAYLADRLAEPAQLKLEHKHIKENRFELLIGGTSTWRTSESDCDTEVKTLRHYLLLGIQRSTPCEFTADHRFTNWPGVQDSEECAVEGNYLAILAFAWAYILSARWVEMQQSKDFKPHHAEKSDCVSYSQAQARWCHDQIFEETSSEDIAVDIGCAGDEAARWWVAILATGEGWHATVVRDGHTYQSPWSIRISASKRFRLCRSDGSICPSPVWFSPPSSEAALRYLSDFCMLHNICGQSSAALAACLFFPFLRDVTAMLPMPKPRLATRSVLSTVTSPSLPKHNVVLEEGMLLTYYMTLSCNTWGVRALLCGVFFDSTICCNVVSPWLEPAFEVLDSVVGEGHYERLAIIMGKRQPKLASLWLGAIITGADKPILRAVHSGLSAVELHAAAWTGTVHSFIGPRPSEPCVVSGCKIRRSDECRLLYLTHCEGFSRVPVCPWQPFGTTPLDHTEIEIQQHISCKGHCLQYLSWCWDSIDGVVAEDKGYNVTTSHSESAASTANSIPSHGQQAVILQSEFLSEAATRSIFGWLRVNGYPSEEKVIYTHSWFDLDNSDDEQDDAASTVNDTSQGMSGKDSLALRAILPRKQCENDLTLPT